MAAASRVLLGLALLLVLASTAEASGAVVVDSPADLDATLKVGESRTFSFDLRNLHPSNLAYVQVAATSAPGWHVVAGPETLRLSPDSTGAAANASARVTVTVTAAGRDYERGTATLTLTITTADGTIRDVRDISLVPASPYILGRFENPLPAPLDGPFGVFLVNLATFSVLGAFVVAVQEPIFRRLVRQSNRPLMDLAVRRLRAPVMILATFVGLQYAVDVLPPTDLVLVTSRILSAGVYAVGLYLGYKLFDSLLTYYGLKVAARTETKLDDVLVPLFRKIAVVIVIVAGLILTLRTLAVDLTVFVAGGVVASMVLAFAAQETLSNFFSGIHLLIDRPFAEGDMIQLSGGEICRVEHIGLRSTRLYHSRRHEIIIMPNNQLSANRVTNLVIPDRSYRIDVDVGVAYSSDIARVKRVLLEIAREHPGVLKDGVRDPQVLFTNFGDSALLFTLRFFVTDIDGRNRIPSEIREAIVTRFRENGVEIPFPQRDLWLRGAARDAVLQVGSPGEVSVVPKDRG